VADREIQRDPSGAGALALIIPLSCCWDRGPAASDGRAYVIITVSALIAAH
jgi:hypothetical protein